MNSLTKKDIMGEVVLKSGLDNKTASDAVEAFIEIIKETLEKGDDVSLSGFGKWQVRHKNARRGRNPQNGKEIIIEPRRVVTFSLSNVLRNKLLGSK